MKLNIMQFNIFSANSLMVIPINFYIYENIYVNCRFYHFTKAIYYKLTTIDSSINLFCI